MIEDGGTDAADGLLVLDVIDRVAPRAGGFKVGAQRGRRRQGLRRTSRQARLDRLGDDRLVGVGEKRLPAAGAVGGLPAADARGHPDRLHGLDLVDVDDIRAHHHGQVYRLAALDHQLPQQRVRDRREVQAFFVGAAEVGGLRPQAVTARLVLLHEPEVAQGTDQAEDRALGQADGVRDLVERGSLRGDGVVPEVVQDRQGATQRRRAVPRAGLVFPARPRDSRNERRGEL
jgi:hypothetical protein